MRPSICATFWEYAERERESESESESESERERERDRKREREGTNLSLDGLFDARTFVDVIGDAFPFVIRHLLYYLDHIRGLYHLDHIRDI